MPPHPMRYALLLCLLSSAYVLRAAEGEAEIPTVGRPADLPFSGASGAFRVRAAAAPTTVEAQTPFTLTLTITAVAAVVRPPSRIDLRDVPAFAQRFDFLEGDREGDRRPDDRTWEFAYRLQPKRADVAVVPGVPFVFFNPEIQYPRKGFQVAYTDPIPLTVAPHTVYSPPMADPPFLFTFAAGAPVLRRENPWAPPSPAATTALLLAPPFLCIGWYLGWRRLYPDAARLARRRRSLAARRALQALRGAGRLPSGQQAARAAGVVANYLRARFDVAIAEPTPEEAAACLGRAGGSAALMEQTMAFFRACDAARFGPTPSPGAGLSAAAARFILAVEAEPWSTPHS